MVTTLETDYLVVGAGAMGMAFVDALLAGSDAEVVLVDRYHQPGGHWTVAYPYVRLHQPSANYGVGSRELGSGYIDEVGGNKGLYELATAGEVCAYFDQVMRQQFLPSGRVSYLPKSEYDGDGRFHSLVTGERFEVRVRRRVVDATYMKVLVPSMRPPAFEVAEDVECVSPNGLAAWRGPAAHYTVVGAGKTGVDACLWLLDNGVAPEELTWIMPRDAWYLDRANLQPGVDGSRWRGERQLARHEMIMGAASVVDLFDRLHAGGQLLRLSEQVRPSMYRCATVTTAELAQLRRIRDVVRLGRVSSIGADIVKLDHGEIPARPGTCYVDCTADGLGKLPAVPVFGDDRITLQPVVTCQQVFSAAFIGHLEATHDGDDARKNVLAAPVPHPDTDTDWLRTTAETNRQLLRWSAEPGVLDWLGRTRLTPMFREAITDPAHQAKFIELIRDETEVLEKLLADHGSGRSGRNRS
ncbi:NAD(P)/FAD-dependent oxidoreductase [Saccharopolyspora shandongensis]|uniref:NAD(P)/FAD-dependent oxidoreductase n=1 Tax=Saccharopolyspora shandongensis TaxID=418495 RepID=UPI003408B951